MPETATKGQVGYFWKGGVQSKAWPNPSDLISQTRICLKRRPAGENSIPMGRDGMRTPHFSVTKTSPPLCWKKTPSLRQSLVLASLPLQVPHPFPVLKGRGSLQPSGMSIFSLAPMISQLHQLLKGGKLWGTYYRGAL